MTAILLRGCFSGFGMTFLEEQMERRPELLVPMDELLARSGGLIDHIEVDLDEDLGKEAFLP
jgi:hypothetical protein